MYNTYSLNKNEGFTLIELLVVIAIIGLLSSVVMVSLDQARKRARDTKRVAEIEQLIQAVEMYHISNAAYPGEGDTDGAIISPSCASYSDFIEDLKNEGYTVSEDPRHNVSCGQSSVNNEDYLYAWDYKIDGGQGTHCIGINRLETDWAVNKLDKYPDNDAGDDFSGSSYGIQYTTSGGDVGIGDGGDFNYCFE